MATETPTLMVKKQDLNFQVVAHLLFLKTGGSKKAQDVVSNCTHKGHLV